MNSTQLEYFLAIVKHGGFAKAADAIFVSQSALSKRIKSLELELGIELFNRKLPGAKLTPEGEEFLAFALEAKQKHTELLTQLGTISTKRGIRIASIPIVAIKPYGIMTKFVSFQSANLDYNLEYTERDQTTILQLLADENADFGIIRDFGSNMHKKYKFLPLYDDEMVLVCAKNHSLAKKKTINLRELKDETFALLDERSQLYTSTVDEFKKLNITPTIAYTNTRHNLVLEMVANGLGITIMPKLIVESSEHDELAIIPLEEAFYTKILLVYDKSKKLTDAHKKFWNFCKK